MMDWPTVLEELQLRVRQASEDDIWCFLTAAGLSDRSLAEAQEAVDVVSAYIPDLDSKRVADLGCGVGRHLAWLADRSGEAVGVESSPALAGLARQFVPGAKVETASFADLAAFGAFDVVCAFSHCLLLGEDLSDVVRTLQLLRGAMPDFGLLVVEVMPIEAGSLIWQGPNGLKVREDRSATENGLQHRFEVTSEGRTTAACFPSTVVDPSRWATLAEEGGFHLESVEQFTYADGTPTTFYFMRAQKGFNFLSDLSEFLESWSDPSHPRNSTHIDWEASDALGRVRPSGPLALGQGASLSRHHPEFEMSIESRIRPLVLELACHWNYVTYSSCAGHLVSFAPRDVYSEAYCGIVTFSNRQISAITRVVGSALAGLEPSSVAVDVRVRPLYGPSAAVTAADILFRRASPGTPWDAYADEVEKVAKAMAEHLAEVRKRA